MKLTVESTKTEVTLDGVECRIWTGTHESGAKVELCVYRLRTEDPLLDLSEFAERDAPSEVKGGPSQLELIIDMLIDDSKRAEILKESVDRSTPEFFVAGIDVGLSLAAMLLRVGRQLDAQASTDQLVESFADTFKGMINRVMR